MLYIVLKFSIMKKNQIILLTLLFANSFLFAQEIPAQLNEAIRLQEQYKEPYQGLALITINRYS